jgi:hypothetical protein
MSPVHLVLTGVLVLAAVVFVLAYRHALAHWLSPVGGALPLATLVGQRARRRFSVGRHFHATIIALAFVSTALMAVMAVAIAVISAAS